MPDKWLSIAAAAATLNVHPRTIERRIAGGKIESRRADDEQTQVLINVPDEMPGANSASSTSPDALETVRELAQDQVSLATGSASAIVRLAQVDADRARGELALVRDEAERIRSGSRRAWSMVAAMAAISIVAVGWTTHRITSADASISEMQRLAERTEREAEKLMSERDAALHEAERAKLASAQTVGRLSAYVEQAQIQAQFQRQPVGSTSDKSPTTQRTAVDQRVFSAIFAR